MSMYPAVGSSFSVVACVSRGSCNKRQQYFKYSPTKLKLLPLNAVGKKTVLEQENATEVVDSLFWKLKLRWQFNVLWLVTVTSRLLIQKNTAYKTGERHLIHNFRQGVPRCQLQVVHRSSVFFYTSTRLRVHTIPRKSQVVIVSSY